MPYDLTISEYGDDGRRLTRAEREARREALLRRAKIANDVKEQGWKINGITQLAHHGMVEMVTLDHDRKQIAGSDLSANLLCVELEEEALRQVKAAQRDLGRKWEL
jgi:hypothetical protein